MSQLRQPYLHSRILIVDDNLANIALLEAILEDAGYDRVESESDPRQVLPRHQRQAFDLILLDIRMPYLDGYGVMQLLQQHQGEEDYLPVLVLTAQNDNETRLKALEYGARDFVTKPFEPYEVLLRIHNQLEVRALYRERQRQNARLEELVVERTGQLLERKRRLAYMASHDPVTALPNRTAFIDHLDTLLTTPDCPPYRLFLLSLEGHRRLDALEGYDFGERILRELGLRLQDAIELRDGFVAYWGGAEFIVVLPETVCHQLHWLEDVLCRPLYIRNYELLLIARAGSVRLPEDGNLSATLLRRAALALSFCPTGSRFTCQTYQPKQEAFVAERQSLESELRHALERDELELFYQPKVDLRHGCIVGAEALLRWRHPERGLVPPGQFVSLAEETGMIDAIGLWAIRRAIDDAHAWEIACGQSLNIAVNVSARQLDLARANGRSLAEEVASILQDSRFPATQLELEITESAIMQDVDYALRELQQLRELGVTLAVDDFGTGYSSLAYLQKLTVNTIKIDRAFIHGMSDSPDACAIVRSILALGRELGLTVVAEGIEHQSDLEVLNQLACDIGQGYLFSRPLPRDAFFEHLQQHALRLVET